MPFAPGHLERARRRRHRSRREQLSVGVAAILLSALIGVAVFSLTTHQAGTGHGCIDFNYTTMIGGAEMHKCGAPARTLCATPASGRSVDTDFTTELYAACRKAGLRTPEAKTHT